jgi:hypothetical protein
LRILRVVWVFLAILAVILLIASSYRLHPRLHHSPRG